MQRRVDRSLASVIPISHCKAVAFCRDSQLILLGGGGSSSKRRSRLLGAFAALRRSAAARKRPFAADVVTPSC